MAHDHHHEDPTAYYLEQLGTIVVCGALGGVALMMWKQGMLNFILATAFHPWVLAGGCALLVLTVLRAVTLWSTVGSKTTHGHGHEHDHACCDDHGHAHTHDHDHAHTHDHDHSHDHAHDHGHAHTHAHETAADPVAVAAPTAHDHGHDHGWSPWRYAVLLLPVVLYFLNLPNAGFSVEAIQRRLQNVDLTGIEAKEFDPAKAGKALGLDFKELDSIANNPEGRAFFQGKMGWLEGQFMPSKDNDKVFTLVRFKITCFAADAVPLNLAIVPPRPVDDLKPLDWVRVEGLIQFHKRKDRNEYLPVLQVATKDKIEPLTKPPANPYIQ